MSASVPTHQSLWGSHQESQQDPLQAPELLRVTMAGEVAKRYKKLVSCLHQTLHPGIYDLNPLGPDRAWPWLDPRKNIGTMGIIYFNKLKMYCAFGKKLINIMLPWSRNNMYQYIFCPNLGNGFPTLKLHKCVSEHSFTCTQFLLLSNVFAGKNFTNLCNSSYMFVIYLYLKSSKL